MKNHFYVVLLMIYTVSSCNTGKTINRDFTELELSFSKEVDDHIVSVLNEHPNSKWYLTYSQICKADSLINKIHINRYDNNKSIFDSVGNVVNVEKYIINHSKKYFDWNHGKIPVVYYVDFKYYNYYSEVG